MAFNISKFASAGLPFGGARPSLFQVTIQMPNGVPNIAERISLTCAASSIPGSTLGVIPVRYFGREIKIPGTRSFQPWSTMILNDEDFQVRNALETWSNLINSHEGNLRSSSLQRNNEVRTVATVTQMSKVNTPLRSYEFVNIFPADIGQIELSWNNGDAIEEFQVTWDYDYWRPVQPGVTGTFQV